MEKTPKFLVLQDQRAEGRYLRVSWHAETRSIVLSHWSDDVCTASTRLALADAPKLISFTVDALHHAASVPLPGPAPVRQGRTLYGKLPPSAQTWLRRMVASAAPVISLAAHKNAGGSSAERPPRERAH